MILIATPAGLRLVPLERATGKPADGRKTTPPVRPYVDTPRTTVLGLRKRL